MTSWNAEYRIKVNGSTVTGVTLTGLSINSGRTNIYSQVVASYCNLTLIETNLNPVTYDINDTVSVEVKNASGVYVFLFGGFITDLTVAVQNSGSTALTQRIQILAVGALARLNRTIYTGNLNHEFDGTRIAYLLSQVLFDAWNEVPVSLTWNSYNPTIIWSNAQNSGYGEVDTPGDYELHQQTNVNDTVYNLVSAAATSGLGYIYEDAQGRIGYADSTHRSEYLSANGYIDLDGNHALGPGLQIIKKAGDVRNSITLLYDGNSQSSVTAENATSIENYGELASKVVTTLRNVTDATIQANYYLDIRALPQFAFSQITFPVASPEIDDADRNSLLSVFMGMPINISNLPSNMVGGYFQGFVEGWSWTAGRNSLNLTLNVSPVDYSLQAMRWSSVPATEYWNTINPGLDWANATIVA